MIERFARFPKALAAVARPATLAGVPALLAHPDWKSPAPVMIWMHGRTASKELDPGRYLRWIRQGIAAVALDLPGHGARLDDRGVRAGSTVSVVTDMVGEIDRVVDALADPAYGDVFDFARMGIGGMSAGGMAALRRLCDGHDFACAAVECTTGCLTDLYFPPGGGPPPWGVPQDRAAVRAIDPSAHLAGFAPIPILMLHAETDRIVPVGLQRQFADLLRARYKAEGASPDLIELRTWSDTGAPDEHSGFGKFGAPAKDAQVEFLTRVLKPA